MQEVKWLHIKLNHSAQLSACLKELMQHVEFQIPVMLMNLLNALLKLTLKKAHQLSTISAIHKCGGMMSFREKKKQVKNGAMIGKNTFLAHITLNVPRKLVANQRLSGVHIVLTVISSKTKIYKRMPR